jgi:hypothetical protein
MPPIVSNEDFLRACFGAVHGDAHVTGFDEDPSDLEALGLRHYWGGQRYNGRLLPTTGNNYFTISLFDPDPEDGKAKRRKALFKATHVIVVDDVGTKVRDTAKLPAPSWKLETSPGNFQWGYLLDTPETDAGRVNALLDGMVAAGLCADGKDPGMKGVTRYVRLPQGRNTKSKYGPNGFACRLASWQPDRKFKIEYLAAPWGIVLPAPGTVPTGGTRGPVMSAQNDPVFGWLDRWGMVDGSRAADGEGWNIECPWIDGHTDRTDTGTAYWPGGAIKCHHGHCERKGRADLLAWVNARLFVEEGFTLAALDFKDADKAALDALWRVLVAGGVLTSQDMRNLALVASRRDVDGLLRDARMFLGTDTAPIRRALARARKRLVRDAVKTAASAKRAANGAVVALPADTATPVSLAEAQATVAEALSALPFNSAAAAKGVLHHRERTPAC